MIYVHTIIIARKWQLENADWEMVDGDKRESVALVEEERLEEERLEEEKYLMARAKETAETSHLTSSEQEETSSFVITSKYSVAAWTCLCCTVGWLVGCLAQLVERRSLTGELSLSCARPAAVFDHLCG